MVVRECLRQQTSLARRGFETRAITVGWVETEQQEEQGGRVEFFPYEDDDVRDYYDALALAGEVARDLPDDLAGDLVAGPWIYDPETDDCQHPAGLLVISQAFRDGVYRLKHMCRLCGKVWYE